MTTLPYRTFLKPTISMRWYKLTSRIHLMMPTLPTRDGGWILVSVVPMDPFFLPSSSSSTTNTVHVYRAKSPPIHFAAVPPPSRLLGHDTDLGGHYSHYLNQPRVERQSFPNHRTGNLTISIPCVVCEAALLPYPSCQPAAVECLSKMGGAWE